MRRPRAPHRRAVAIASVTAGVLVVVSLGAADATDRAARTVEAGPGRPPVTTAAAFADSVGVNIHAYYDDTSYADSGRVLRLLQALRIRHVRDRLVAGRPDQVAAIRKLGAAGIRQSLIIGDAHDTTAGTVPADVVSALRTVAPHVEAVEPSNEYDCGSGFASGWSTRQRTYTRALAQVARGLPGPRVDVLGPAWCRVASVRDFGAVPSGVTATNAHTYAPSTTPELQLESRLPLWSGVQAPALPLDITETGYHDLFKPGAEHQGVAEQTAADYLLRTLLSATRLGVRRTYLYELMDEKPDPQRVDPEQHYGLVRVDGSAKPAYAALRALMGDLAPRTSGSTAARTATASVRGGGSLLRSVRITDARTGGETLALWLATPLENPETGRALPNPSVRVQVATTTAATAVLRRPSRGNVAASAGTGRTFTVPVDGAVTLLRLVPARRASSTRACAAAPGYRARAASLGSVLYDDVAPGSWATAVPAATGLPDGLVAGSSITRDSLVRRIPVPGSPTAWTIAIWQRSRSGAADFAWFLRAVGPRDAGLRTYALGGDVPANQQLSAYAGTVPQGDLRHEMWGQSTPDSWHLLTITSTNGLATFSVDGVAQATVVAQASALQAVDIGSVSAGYRGDLAGLAVFDRRLIPLEMLDLATTSAGVCASSATSGRR